MNRPGSGGVLVDVSTRAVVAVLGIVSLMAGCRSDRVPAQSSRTPAASVSQPPPSHGTAAPNPLPSLAATPSASAVPAPTSLAAVPPRAVTAVVAASALDAQRVGALLESCADTSCHDRLALSHDGGRTWQLGPTMPRYGPDNRLHGLLALDANHWFAYGTSGWFTADAGRTWRRSRGGYVVTAGRAGSQLWAIRSGCTPKCWQVYDLLNADGSIGFLGELPWQTEGIRVTAADWTNDRAYVVTTSGNTSRLLVLDHRLRLLVAHAMPKPGGGVLASVGPRSLDYLNFTEPAAGTQPKMFWHSDDDGRTWQRRPDPLLRGYAVAMTAPAPGLLWRYGYRSEIWRSTDDGASWVPLLASKVGEGGYTLQAFASYARTAWAFAFLNDDDEPGVYVTDDAGRRWSTVRLPDTP